MLCSGRGCPCNTVGLGLFVSCFVQGVEGTLRWVRSSGTLSWFGVQEMLPSTVVGTGERAEKVLPGRKPPGLVGRAREGAGQALSARAHV